MSLKLFFVPSIFTMLNLILGVVSIAVTVSGNTVLGAWFVILAIFCDGMDGKIARWTNSTSAFGNELDSLSDLTSSGVAPGLIVFVSLAPLGFSIPFFFMIIFVVAGAYRLARFNIIQNGDRTKGYIGLPIPVAGFTIAAFILFMNWNFIGLVTIKWLFFIVPVLSFLMISTVHYNWPKLEFDKGGFKIMMSVSKIIMLIIMTIFPHAVLFPLFIGYVLYGFVNWVININIRDISVAYLFWPKIKP